MRRTIVSIGLVLSINCFIYPSFVAAANITAQSGQIKNAAYINAVDVEGRFSLFGYSSPKATVKIINPGMYSDTKADATTGFFEFTRLFSSLIIEDICLIAQDTEGRVTVPVCIPPIPSSTDSSIGPINMPPTISINGASFFMGDHITMSGQTTPTKDVKLSMYTDVAKNGLKAFKSPGLIGKVEAATLPKQTLKADSNGRFTYSPASDNPEYYRTFAQTLYEGALSPRSIVLNFDILPAWFMVIKFLTGLYAFLKDHLFETIVIIQMGVILYFIYKKFLHPYALANRRALMVRSHPYPVLLPHILSISDHSLLLTKHDLLKQE